MIYIVIVTKSTQRGFHYFPKPTTRVVTSVLINGTEFKNDIIDGTVRKTVTKAVSEFEFKLKNGAGQNLNNVKLGDVIKFYLDFTTGTTQLFEGTVQSIKYFDMPPYISIRAYGYEVDALNRLVNKTYTNTSIYQIFQELITNNLTGHTFTNVSVSDEMATLVNVSWSGKNVFGAMQDLMVLTGNTHDFYCDFSKDWHVFRKGSIKKLNEAIVFGRTLRQIDLDNSVLDASNKITVQGATINGIPIMYTATTGYGSSAPDVIVKDSNLTTYEAVKDKATQLAIIKATTEKKGRTISTIMPNLTQGDKIYIFAPYHNVNGFFIINDFEHNITSGGISTKCTFQEISKEQSSLANFLIGMAKNQQNISQIENEFNMNYAIKFDFTDTTNIDTTNSSNNLSISNNTLILNSGTTGTLVTTTHNADISNVTSAVIKISTDDLPNASILISNDNGVSYNAVNPNTLYTFTGNGNQIKVKINIASNTVKIRSLGILYN